VPRAAVASAGPLENVRRAPRGTVAVAVMSAAVGGDRRTAGARNGFFLVSPAAEHRNTRADRTILFIVAP